MFSSWRNTCRKGFEAICRVDGESAPAGQQFQPKLGERKLTGAARGAVLMRLPFLGFLSSLLAFVWYGPTQVSLFPRCYWLGHHSPSFLRVCGLSTREFSNTRKTITLHSLSPTRSPAIHGYLAPTHYHLRIGAEAALKALVENSKNVKLDTWTTTVSRKAHRTRTFARRLDSWINVKVYIYIYYGTKQFWR